MVLDGGPTPIGVESTVLDLTTSPPTVLRPGGISLSELATHLGRVEMHERVAVPEHTLEPGMGLAGPGMLERHYAPDAELWLCVGPPAAARAWMLQQVEALGSVGQRVGALVYEEDQAQFAQLAVPVDIEVLGSEHHPQQIAQRLYAALRALDARHPDMILARDAGRDGLALAITDRLTRASSGRVVHLEPDSSPPESASG
jgi:L-threonylcarbamoyladenylate synthase